MCLSDFTLRVTEVLVCYSTRGDRKYGAPKVLPPEFLLEIISMNASLYV